jgi:hypothetical protein
MPDSFPTIGWGPAPFDERDLDALLSGHMADLPPALYQVADALIALHAPPTRAELGSEAAIMAEFSALAEIGAFRPGGAAWAHTDGKEHTLVLPALTPDDVARGRRMRHRGRQASRSVSWRAGALMGAAAAAVILIVAVFSGSLRGSMERLAHLSTSSPTAHHTVGGSASQGVAATSAAPERTASRKPMSAAHSTTPQSQASTLCDAWLDDFAHAPHARWGAELSLFWQISRLAGGPDHVFAYCAPYARNMFPHGIPGGFFPGGKNSHGRGKKPHPGGVGHDGQRGSQGQSLTDPGSASGNGKAASPSGQQ